MKKVTVHDATEANALEIALFKWRIGVCADNETDPSVLKIIKRGGITPSAAKHAAQLFEDVIETTDDWWTLYVACKCGAIENDEKACEVFDSAFALGWGTELLKTKIREARANSKPARAKRAAKPCAGCAALENAKALIEDDESVWDNNRDNNFNDQCHYCGEYRHIGTGHKTDCKWLAYRAALDAAAEGKAK